MTYNSTSFQADVSCQAREYVKIVSYLVMKIDILVIHTCMEPCRNLVARKVDGMHVF